MQAWLGGNLQFNGDLLALLPAIGATSIRLATNQEPERGEFIRSNYATHGCIEGMYFSHEIGHRKPFPEYFEHIVADLDCQPEEILFVDDFVEHVEGARSCGISAIRFIDNKTLLSDLAAHGIYEPDRTRRRFV